MFPCFCSILDAIDFEIVTISFAWKTNVHLQTSITKFASKPHMEIIEATIPAILDFFLEIIMIYVKSG